jgi:hypothetical protein
VPPEELSPEGQLLLPAWPPAAPELLPPPLLDVVED